MFVCFVCALCVCVRVCVCYLVLVLAEGLQDVRLAGVVPVGVLQTLQQTLLQDEDRHPQLVPQQLPRPEPRDTAKPWRLAAAPRRGCLIVIDLPDIKPD